MDFPIIGVAGGSGGVGTSTFAAVLALVAARACGGALLADLDPVGGGMDVVLGVEAESGARWSGLLLTGGHLDPADLASGLPRWGPVGVLAHDGRPPPEPTVVGGMSAGAASGAVVADLGRACALEALAAVPACVVVVVVVRADVPGLTAARATRRSIAGSAPDVPVGVLVRGGGRVDSRRAADAVGGHLLGRLPSAERLRQPLPPHAVPSALLRAARGVLDGVRP